MHNVDTHRGVVLRLPSRRQTVGWSPRRAVGRFGSAFEYRQKTIKSSAQSERKFHVSKQSTEKVSWAVGNLIEELRNDGDVGWNIYEQGRGAEAGC